MTKPQIESSLELLRSYQAFIKQLEDDREKIDTALRVLRSRLAEHERVEGFKPDMPYCPHGVQTGLSCAICNPD